MGSSQNLQAISNAQAGGEPEAEPQSERRLGVHAALVSLLEMAFGSRDAAIGALDRALAVAGLDVLPEVRGGLLGFVRGQLADALTADIGPSLTAALVEDFAARLEPAEHTEDARPGSSAPPRSVPRAVARVTLRPRSSAPAPPEMHALLVDGDRVGRASLARALLRARWGVRVVESVEDLGDALREPTPIHALIVDVQHAAAVEMVRALIGVAPSVRVIVRGPEGARARALLQVAGPGRGELRPREASAEELIAAVLLSAGR